MKDEPSPAAYVATAPQQMADIARMMIMKTSRARFWEPGFSIFTDELLKEERERLKPLQEEMKKTDDPNVKARLKEDIGKIKAEFREKHKSASRSLFARS